MRVCSLCRHCYDDSIVSCAEEGHPVLSETRNGDREMVPGYRLDSLHELTGSSETYRAAQKTSGQACLIKILTADETDAQRFRDEAKVAAAFFHPNVADIYETGISNIGEPFVVMGDVDGQTLRDSLSSVGPPPLLTAVQIARQAAEALYAVHLSGLTHRAIDPANIILTTDAEHRLLVKIQNFDFGGVNERFIASNRFLGETDLYSLRYFAPEQCAGQTSSAQTDIYSLGVVFYEMLAGVPPFEGQTAAALIDQHRNRPVPEIKIDNFDLRMLLTHTLTESLQKRAQVRQSSANAFARQFRHIEQLGTHSSTPPPAGAVPPAHKVAAAATASVQAKVAPVPAPEVIVARAERVYEKSVRPSAVRVESQPVFVGIGIDAGTPVGPENESSVTSSAVKREAVSFAQENPNNNSPEIPDLTLQEPAAESGFQQKTVLEDKRSQLKLRRKRSRAKTVLALARTRESEPLAPAGITTINLVENRSELVEARVAQVEPEKITVVPLHNKPRKVEWQQLDNDIPSEADILEILAKEQIAETPLVLAGADMMKVSAVQNEPTATRESTRAERDVPSKDELLEVLSMESIPEHSFAQVDTEEITLVRPSTRRIRIEWDQLSRHMSDEVQFRPTILRGWAKSETVDPDDDDSMFASYAQSGQHYSIPHRSLIIGGGLMLLFALFLFGIAPIREYFQTTSSGESVEARTILPGGPNIGQPAAVSIPKKKTQKSTDRSAPPDDYADDDRSKPLPPKERSLRTTDRQQNSTVKAEPIPATLVIYSENGKTKSKYIQGDSKANDEKSLPLRDKSVNPGRPRIVKNPEP